MFNETDCERRLCHRVDRARRQRRARLLLTAAFLACICVGSHGAAQAPKSEPNDEEATRLRTDWSDVIRRTVDEYTLYLDVSPRKPLTLQRRPVLRWENNTRATADAFTYLWIADGRPEAVVGLYMWGQDEIGHAFGSLSRGRLIAERNGKRVWYPRRPGVTFTAVPDAPAPADSRIARLREMKMLARRFSSVLVGWDSAPTNEPLRLLPRELYRYETEGPEVLDGAVFAFVQGTDPEALLLLEAVQVASGHQWQYAPVSRTSAAVYVRYRDKVVWSVPMYLAVDPLHTFMNVRHKIDPKMIPRQP